MMKTGNRKPDESAVRNPRQEAAKRSTQTKRKSASGSFQAKDAIRARSEQEAKGQSQAKPPAKDPRWVILKVDGVPIKDRPTKRDLKSRKSPLELLKEQSLGQIPETNYNNVDAPFQKFSPKGRTLRKAFERPRPDLPANAQENRTRKPVTATLPPDLIAQVNDRCRELGVDRTAFIEAAIRQALEPS